MTEIDEATAPFTEAEIKEHHATLIRQMVAVGVIICAMLMLVGTASLIIDTARSVVGLLSAVLRLQSFFELFDSLSPLRLLVWCRG
jgi:hypothetical protein